ncbi:MAG TPA: glycoside hydrolase family 127 protein [Candidatus Atribacteria bacterium]|nr:glycoside hydrolase family 127 protein [Candidatus Atribacteria bacterium]
MSQDFIVNTSKSKYARLRSVPISSVKLTDSFWANRIKLMGEVTLPLQYQIMEETGRLDNFRIAAGKISGEFSGFFFNDSDVYKWIEAASYFLAVNKDEELDKLVDSVVEEIRDAQDEDGYLDTYFTFSRKQDRWTNLKDMHELYCAGHLFQAAIAHHRATGKTNFLDIAIRLADHITRVFGPGKKEGVPGHPQIEMALVELYRETNDRKYLDLAKFFIDERGKGLIGGSSYHIDHKPFRELDEIVGHAVRSLYLNSGATDLYMETGDKTLWDTLERLWDNLVTKKMYVTGAAGARHEGEAFGDPYELPNETAYAETCAAIANFMWNYRMLLASGESRFADVMELALYNGVLSGISIDGKEYFYVNPLADRGGHRRQRWFACACCPPNIARTITSIPGYIYSISQEGIWVNLYASNVSEFDINGSKVAIEEKTDYPWEGLVEFKVDADSSFSIFLRKPEWSREFSLNVNGERFEPALEKGYMVINRRWQKGDTVTLDLHMRPEFLESHPGVKDNVGRVAIRRGPVVYCVEAEDNPGVDVWDLEIPKDTKISKEYRDTLGGIVAIKGGGYINEPGAWEKLYLSLEEANRLKKEIEFAAIPYYAWANRTPGPMEVWIKTK